MTERSPETWSASARRSIASHPYLGAFEFHEDLPSTNDLGLRRAASDDLATPALILAARQSAGRGRGDNTWWATNGALTFSLVVETGTRGESDESPAVMSLVTALAIRAGLEKVHPAGDLSVKWPNDVFLDGKKIAGILLERSSQRPQRVVIGIGVNVNNRMTNASKEVREHATSLHDATGVPHRLPDVLVSLLTQIERHDLLHRKRQLVLDSQWRPHCLLTDRVVTIENPASRVTGICRGIDSSGALLVRSETQTHRVCSGTVLRYS